MLKSQIVCLLFHAPLANQTISDLMSWPRRSINRITRPNWHRQKGAHWLKWNSNKTQVKQTVKGRERGREVWNEKGHMRIIYGPQTWDQHSISFPPFCFFLSQREKWLSHSRRFPLKGYCHLHFSAFLSWITDFLFSLFALSSIVLPPFPNSFLHRCMIYSLCETVHEISVMGSDWIMWIR